MKKLITLTVALLITITSFCQKTYMAYRTEIYKYKNDEWVFSSGNKKVEIPIYVYKRFIHVQAKDNAYFLLEEKSTEISGETFKGYSYNSYEFVTQLNCTVHIVDIDNEESMISVIWFDEGINIRYYIK